MVSGQKSNLCTLGRKALIIEMCMLIITASIGLATSLNIPTSLSMKKISLTLTSQIDSKNARISCTALNTATRDPLSQSRSKRKKWHPCDPNPEEPKEATELDRREAAFAMVGNLWSRGIVPTAAISTLLSFPLENNPNQVAHAVYGSDANIQLPNVMEGLDNRINKQCLAESLGNRECLVYMDPENQLYKGANSDLLLLRLEKSTESLASIPDLVKNKQWSKVQGVITGPMGTLFSTMNELAKLTDHSETLMNIAKRVKLDLYAISAATEKKQADLIMKSHQSATDNLIAFVAAL